MPSVVTVIGFFASNESSYLCGGIMMDQSILDFGLVILMMKKLFTTFCLIFVATFAAFGQESLGTYQIRIAPDRDSWIYELNEPAKFEMAVTLNNRQVSGLSVKYSCGLEMMKPTVEKTMTTTAQPVMIDGGTLKEAGFLRCIATFEKGGITYRGVGTAAFRPDLIKPTVTEPKDFEEFWNKGKADLAKIPMDAKFELMPTLGSSKVDVYHVSFQNVGAGSNRISRIYGMLAMPKETYAGQKFPAIMRPPGAGVRPYVGQVAMAERGIIVLEIGIHGIPVNLPQLIYDELRNTALSRYSTYNMNDKNEYYYRRVYLGCLRANDFLYTLPQFDGKNLGVTGGSQGGGLALVTAALDLRVKGLAASYPALSDMTGYVFGRAGGWFHGLRDIKNQTKENIETLSYYDAVNFAKRVKVPGMYSMSYNDEVVPPTSSYAAYNSITAPKKLILGLELGHANSPEQNSRLNDFIEKLLKEGKFE